MSRARRRRKIQKLLEENVHPTKRAARRWLRVMHLYSRNSEHPPVKHRSARQWWKNYHMSDVLLSHRLRSLRLTRDYTHAEGDMS